MCEVALAVHASVISVLCVYPSVGHSLGCGLSSEAVIWCRRAWIDTVCVWIRLREPGDRWNTRDFALVSMAWATLGCQPQLETVL